MFSEREKQYRSNFLAVARQKLAELPEENKKTFVPREGNLVLQDVPLLQTAVTFNLSQLKHLLRYNPYSELFGAKK